MHSKGNHKQNEKTTYRIGEGKKNQHQSTSGNGDSHFDTSWKITKAPEHQTFLKAPELLKIK